MKNTRNMKTSKSDGAFYTLPRAANMLAEMVIREMDTSLPARVLDPACGSGILLKTVWDNWPEEHRHNLYLEGWEINAEACRRAREALPEARITLMAHGLQPDGTVRAGAVEVLIDGYKGELFDLVIMNPPYSANKNRSTKAGLTIKHMMQARERRIKACVLGRDKQAGQMMTANSISTFFDVLADHVLSTNGRLAMVKPATAWTGVSGQPARVFWGRGYNVKTVLTSHGPKSVNFSEDTGIHESLMVARKGGCGEGTRFVQLLDDGRRQEVWQPSGQIRQGDWRPCQFYDEELSRAAQQIENHAQTTRLDSLWPHGPISQSVHAAFKPCEEEVAQAHLFWGRSKDLRTTMAAEPEMPVVFRQPRQAQRYMTESSHLLLAFRFTTTSARLLAIVSERPSCGTMWASVQAGLNDAKAACAWFNSTSGALGFMFNRGETLCNAKFQPKTRALLPVPDFRRLDPAPLIDAYERTCHTPVQAWKHAQTDPVRDILDQAASKVVGVDIETVRDWRRRLSIEPTISNRLPPE